MSGSTTADSPLTKCDCVSVTCTRCSEPYIDAESEMPRCFESPSHALSVLAQEDWEISDDTIECPTCISGTTVPVNSLAVCEFCSPPLFSDSPLPDRCRCADQPVIHTFVPLLSAHHPAIRRRTCVEGHCSDCDKPLGIDDVAVHYDSAESAFEFAAAAGWMLAADLDLLLCPSCVTRRAREALDHTGTQTTAVESRTGRHGADKDTIAAVGGPAPYRDGIR